MTYKRDSMNKSHKGNAKQSSQVGHFLLCHSSRKQLCLGTGKKLK